MKTYEAKLSYWVSTFNSLIIQSKADLNLKKPKLPNCQSSSILNTVKAEFDFLAERPHNGALKSVSPLFQSDLFPLHYSKLSHNCLISHRLLQAELVFFRSAENKTFFSFLYFEHKKERASEGDISVANRVLPDFSYFLFELES